MSDRLRAVSGRIEWRLVELRVPVVRHRQIADDKPAANDEKEKEDQR